MAKLINILAASLGSGLLLGAGFRLGEKLAGEERAAEGAGGTTAAGAAPAEHFGGGHFAGANVAGEMSERLGFLEGRLSHLETVAVPPPMPPIDLSGLEARLAAQAREVAAVRMRLDEGAGRIESLGQTDERLRNELRGWVDKRVDERLKGVESKLRAESDEAQREMLSAVIDSVQTRVILRISKLEEELAGQANGMMELRDCTLRTEDSMQKLLGGIDRLIAAQQQPARAPKPAPAPEPAPEFRAKTAPAPEAVNARPRQPESAPQPKRAESPAAVKSAADAPARPVVMPSLDSPRRRWSIFG